jgi:hypothetical protein
LFVQVLVDQVLFELEPPQDEELHQLDGLFTTSNFKLPSLID